MVPSALEDAKESCSLTLPMTPQSARSQGYKFNLESTQRDRGDTALLTTVAFWFVLVWFVVH